MGSGVIPQPQWSHIIPIALNANTSKTIHCPNNCKFFFVLASASANARGWGVVNTTSAGAVSYTASSMSSVSISTSANAVSFSSSYNANGVMVVIYGDDPW